MKKTYMKPQLWTESFQPADAIAGNCTYDVGFGDGGELGSKQCSLNESGMNLFVSRPVCSDLWEVGEDKPCYHSSQASQGYFGS